MPLDNTTQGRTIPVGDLPQFNTATVSAIDGTERTGPLVVITFYGADGKPVGSMSMPPWAAIQFATDIKCATKRAKQGRFDGRVIYSK